MKCLNPNCDNEIIIQLASKINCKNCKILASFTSIITVQCNKCRNIFQIPIKNKSFFNIKKDE